MHWKVSSGTAVGISKQHMTHVARQTGSPDSRCVRGPATNTHVALVKALAITASSCWCSILSNCLSLRRPCSDGLTAHGVEFPVFFFLPLNLAGPVSSRQTPHWRGTVAGGKLPCSQSARPNALTGLGSGLCRPFSLEAYRLQFVYYACHVIIAPRPLIDGQIDRVRRTGLRPGPVSRG